MVIGLADSKDASKYATHCQAWLGMIDAVTSRIAPGRLIGVGGCDVKRRLAPFRVLAPVGVAGGWELLLLSSQTRVNR